jgi:hypothetical protein
MADDFDVEAMLEEPYRKEVGQTLLKIPAGLALLLTFYVCEACKFGV